MKTASAKNRGSREFVCHFRSLFLICMILAGMNLPVDGYAKQPDEGMDPVGKERAQQGSSRSIGELSSDDIGRRKALLETILQLLPPDRTSNGRVSFLDETFKDWLKRTGELPPDFDLLPSIPGLPDPLILDEGDKNIPITNLSQWNEKRDWMKEQLAHYISGTCPPAPENLRSSVISEMQDGDVIVRQVELTFGPANRAKLTLELMIPPGKGPFPVYLTNWTHREWAQIAVRRGYIGCLYSGADSKDDTEEYSEIWAGEYDFTRLMRRAYGASRAIDYLYQLPYVDKDKIGITGHSRNGKTSLMAAAFDERIGACIPSSGGTGAEVPWRFCSHRYDVEDIALLACAQPAWLHPRLRFFIGRENKLPVDQNHFMALIAPRGLMLSTAITESASNPFGIEQAYHSAEKVYRFLNAENNLAIVSRYGLHGVNAKDLEGYVDFFDYVFGRSNRKPENRLNCEYSFAQWQQLSGEKVDPSKFEARGLNELVKDPKTGKPITLQEWEKGKKTVLENVSWILGNEPAGVTNFGPKSLSNGGVGEDRFGSFLTRPAATDRMKVMAITPYSGFGDNLFGYLYYPADDQGKLTTGELPVVIYLHEYDYSKGFTAMGFDHEIQSVLRTLTGMGFGVFAFDMHGFGNRLEEATHFYERYPQWSKMGKMVADVKGAVDAIANLDFVDESRIYALGYSLGGAVGLFSAALDQRIAGVISVAGFTPLRTDVAGRGTLGIQSWSHLHGLIPRLGFFTGNEERIPVDFHEVIAAIAPRPVLVIAPEMDKDAHLDDVTKAVDHARKVFEMYGQGQKLGIFTPKDYNRFAPSMRDEVYRWLDIIR